MYSSLDSLENIEKCKEKITLSLHLLIPVKVVPCDVFFALGSFYWIHVLVNGNLKSQGFHFCSLGRCLLCDKPYKISVRESLPVSCSHTFVGSSDTKPNMK